MADTRLNTLVWSGVLIVSGIILLLFNFQVMARFEPVPQLILAGILAAGASGFFLGYFVSEGDWARLVPAWTLLALASMVVASIFPVMMSPPLTAALLFLGLSIAFANVYLLKRTERWWAVIPGGFMLVIGLVVGLSGSVERMETLAAILFVGMGTVFFLLHWLDGQRRRWWALVPGSVLLFFGLFVLTLDTMSENVVSRWWPLLLISLGLFVAGFTYRRRPAEKLAVNSAPSVRRPVENSPAPAQARLGEYTRPAPGASVEVLQDPDGDA